VSRALAVALLVLAACEKKAPPAAVDAGPRAIDLERARVVPCLIAGGGAEAAAACARDTYEAEPRWICPVANGFDAYFARSGDAGFAKVVVHADEQTIDRAPVLGQPAPDPAKCTTPPDAEPPTESLARPPSLPKSIKAATELVEKLPKHRAAVPAGTCTRQLYATGCEANFGSSRWILFAGASETFFVRVDASLHARFDDPFPDSSPAKPMPWARCECEDLPGFRVAAAK
jgi:hypothetical protein